jgi:hypothetical protein
MRIKLAENSIPRCGSGAPRDCAPRVSKIAWWTPSPGSPAPAGSPPSPPRGRGWWFDDFVERSAAGRRVPEHDQLDRQSREAGRPSGRAGPSWGPLPPG